jgi:hypothetical protein
MEDVLDSTVCPQLLVESAVRGEGTLTKLTIF